MAVLLLLNLLEIDKCISTLLLSSGALIDLGKKYQEGMASMAECWQGGSGESFAGAAEKVQAGFFVNGYALGKMINDATTSRRLVEGQDALAASQVDEMAPIPYKQGRAVR